MDSKDKPGIKAIPRSQPKSLMDREPGSVLALWILGVIATLLFGMIHLYLGGISVVITGILILAKIDSNNKLLGKQINNHQHN